MPEIHRMNVDLTADQIRYLAHRPNARRLKGKVITMVDSEGWIFVEAKATVGEEGSGVWVDPQGREHHGPSSST